MKTTLDQVKDQSLDQQTRLMTSSLSIDEQLLVAKVMGLTCKWSCKARMLLAQFLFEDGLDDLKDFGPEICNISPDGPAVVNETDMDVPCTQPKERT
jgi:hypothetical protein